MLVVGSYFLAEELKVRRPRRRAPAARSAAPPAAAGGRLRRRRCFRPPRRRRWSAWLARAARLRGDRAALTADETVGYAGLYERARAVAGGLRDRGVGRGDRVALALASEQLVVALHGCLLIGAVAVPIDLRL